MFVNVDNLEFKDTYEEILKSLEEQGTNLIYPVPKEELESEE